MILQKKQGVMDLDSEMLPSRSNEGQLEKRGRVKRYGFFSVLKRPFVSNYSFFPSQNKELFCGTM